MDPPRRPDDGSEMRRRKSWHPPSTSSKRRRVQDPLADISWIVNEARLWNPVPLPDGHDAAVVYTENNNHQDALADALRREYIVRDEHGRRVRSRTAQPSRASSPETAAISTPAMTAVPTESDSVHGTQRRRVYPALPTLQLPPRINNNTITHLSSSPTSSPRTAYFSAENTSSTSHLAVQGSSPLTRAQSDSSVYPTRSFDLSGHDRFENSRNMLARPVSPSLRGPPPLMRREPSYTSAANPNSAELTVSATIRHTRRTRLESHLSDQPMHDESSPYVLHNTNVTSDLQPEESESTATGYEGSSFFGSFGHVDAS